MGVRISHNSQPGRHAVPDVTGTMPCLRRGVDNVALIGDEEGHVTHKLVLPSIMNHASGPVK